MFLEQQIASYLKAFASSSTSERTPDDDACLKRFDTHQWLAMAGALGKTSLLGYNLVRPSLLLAQPPRLAMFAGQITLVTTFSLITTFYLSRFTAIQCTACLMGVDSVVGSEARRLVGTGKVNREMFWELARQIGGEERRDFVEGERVRSGVLSVEEKKRAKEGK